MKKITLVFALLALVFTAMLSGCGSGGGNATQYEFTPDTNTLALWHFNDSTGAAFAADSCNHYPLYLHGTTPPTFVSRDSHFGNCLNLDSTQRQYLFSDNYTTQMNYGTQLTVEFWMKFTTSTNAQILMDVDPAIYIYKDLNNKMHTQIYDASTGGGGSWNGLLDSTTVMALNTWHYVVLTYDGTNTNLYLDGTLDCHIAARFIPYTNPSRGWWIGTNGTQPNSWYFNGQIDEMRILNYARTASDISTYYNQVISN